MMHRFLMWLTKNRPCKKITVNDKPYLERYYMGSVLGRQIWLHRFLSCDGESHHHDHPWDAVSVVLSGGYVEHQTLNRRLIVRRRHVLSGLARIGVSTVHRIHRVFPNTWTLMVVSKTRQPTWRFYANGRVTALMASSPADWWRFCQPRGTDEAD